MIINKRIRKGVKMISFTIPGEPQGKARARVCKGFTYTPAKTVNYEALIKQTYAYEAKSKLIEKAVELTVKAYFMIPKSYTKGRRLAAEHNITRPTKKPDADNILKIVADALNGIAYKDDTQVVRAVVEKWFSDTPRVEVEIKELEV